MNSHKKWIGYLCAFFTIFVWGTTFIASKKLLAYYTPAQVMLTRFLLAYLLLLLLRPRRLKLTRREEASFFLMGLFACSLYFLTENTALTYTLASNVSILVSVAPIFTAVLAHFATDEKFHVGTLVSFLVSFAGVVLVVCNGAFVLKLSPRGDLLAILSAMSWALYSVLVKPFTLRFDSILLTRRILFWGIVTALPIALIQGVPYSIQALTRPVVFGNYLFLGLLGSAVCYVLWNEAFRRLGIVATNSFIYAIPFVTIVAAAVFLNEPITPAAIGGAALITAGVVQAERSGGKAEKQSDAQPTDTAK